MVEIQFEWDIWNKQKNEAKHGVSALEAESAFYDLKYKLFEDKAHSTSTEEHYILYGKSLEGRILMVGFTLRKKRIRIITARSGSKKERRLYEK